jgi:hypothetical protein
MLRKYLKASNEIPVSVGSFPGLIMNIYMSVYLFTFMKHDMRLTPVQSSPS